MRFCWLLLPPCASFPPHLFTRFFHVLLGFHNGVVPCVSSTVFAVSGVFPVKSCNASKKRGFVDRQSGGTRSARVDCCGRAVWVVTTIAGACSLRRMLKASRVLDLVSHFKSREVYEGTATPSTVCRSFSLAHWSSTLDRMGFSVAPSSMCLLHESICVVGYLLCGAVRWRTFCVCRYRVARCVVCVCCCGGPGAPDVVCDVVSELRAVLQAVLWLWVAVALSVHCRLLSTFRALRRIGGCGAHNLLSQ